MCNKNSCVGCKFLYTEGEGYSNWTWMDNIIKCSKDKNPNLPVIEGSDWNKEQDNCPATMSSKCELYKEGVLVTLDIDGEDNAADWTNDPEQIESINTHCGRTT